MRFTYPPYFESKNREQYGPEYHTFSTAQVSTRSLEAAKRNPGQFVASRIPMRCIQARWQPHRQGGQGWV